MESLESTFLAGISFVAFMTLLLTRFESKTPQWISIGFTLIGLTGTFVSPGWTLYWLTMALLSFLFSWSESSAKYPTLNQIVHLLAPAGALSLTPLLSGTESEALAPQLLTYPFLLWFGTSSILTLKSSLHAQWRAASSPSTPDPLHTLVHDLRSPVATLRVLSDQIQTRLPSDAPELQLLRHTVDRVETLTRTTRAMSRKHHQAKLISIDRLEPTIERLIHEKRLSLRPQVRLHFKLVYHSRVRATLPFIESDFLRILSNLLDNAAESILDVGSIDCRVTLHSDTLEIVVRDTGLGLSEVVQRALIVGGRIPTTKSKGSGLGLTSIKAWVEQNGGVLEFTSRRSAGTEFRIFLPL